VISEVKLPSLDGLDLVKLFRAHALLEHIPFVFLSTGASPNDVMRFIGAGATQYLYKSRARKKVVKVVATIAAR
jgi:DNA-binding NarL/FixJ family response regulator